MAQRSSQAQRHALLLLMLTIQELAPAASSRTARAPPAPQASTGTHVQQCKPFVPAPHAPEPATDLMHATPEQHLTCCALPDREACDPTPSRLQACKAVRPPCHRWHITRCILQCCEPCGSPPLASSPQASTHAWR